MLSPGLARAGGGLLVCLLGPGLTTRAALHAPLQVQLAGGKAETVAGAHLHGITVARWVEDLRPGEPHRTLCQSTEQPLKIPTNSG